MHLACIFILTNICCYFQLKPFIAGGISVISTLVAFVFYLLFEAPYVNLFKLIMTPILKSYESKADIGEGGTQMTRSDHNKNTSTIA